VVRVTGGPRVLCSKKVSGITLEAIQGDITDLPVDAITNAANDHLWMGAGVAGAIKDRGGISIEREAVAMGPVPVGSAVVTGAGDLKAKYVIHAAVMGQDLRTDVTRVIATTRSVLKMAEELRLGSLAMPLLGTGVGGLDPGEVAIVMAGQVAEMAMADRCAGLRVLLVGYDDTAAEAVKWAIEGL
jgi:O-acetyl-ADP-ribose deacetylase (regulator of RNase III)